MGYHFVVWWCCPGGFVYRLSISSNLAWDGRFPTRMASSCLLVISSSMLVDYQEKERFLFMLVSRDPSLMVMHALSTLSFAVQTWHLNHFSWNIVVVLRFLHPSFIADKWSMLDVRYVVLWCILSIWSSLSLWCSLGVSVWIPVYLCSSSSLHV